MKFAELTPGKCFTLGPATVSAQEIVEFASKYDEQWFHTDPMRAESGSWNGLIASGWHTCAIAMGLVSRQILDGSESYASPGLNYLKWPHPVRPDDQLTLHVTVLEAKISSSKPWLGIIRWQWVLRNQLRVDVLDLEATSLFKLVAEAENLAD